MNPRRRNPFSALFEDIRDPRLIYLKGILFLLGGFLAAGALLAEIPTWRAALLLALSVCCFARFYYFAFYVIERYVDPGYRFAGLGSFLMYLLRRRRAGRGNAGNGDEGRPKGDAPVRERLTDPPGD